MRYDAVPVGNIVLSYGKPEAFVSESYRPHFICSVCRQQINEKVVTLAGKREHLVFHLECVDKLTLAIEQALTSMGYDFIEESLDGAACSE